MWSAPGMWTSTFSNVLRTHDLESYIPYAFACNAVAAFISPLFVGALADRSFSPERLLRWLNWSSGLFLGLTFLAIDCHWSGGVLLSLNMGYSLCTSPIFSLTTTIALMQMSDPRRFGPLRLWGTLGWAVAGWVVSWGLHADSSTLSGYAAAALMILVGCLTYVLGESLPPPSFSHKTWKERLGLDALELIHHKDHRIVFITTALFSIPLAAFFPYTPIHLREQGAAFPAALMAFGQVSELICLLFLAKVIAHVRLKWIFLAGIFFGVLRFAFFSLDTQFWLIAGITLHGLCYSLFFVTGQIYLAERIERNMQARAQALLSLLINGVGNLAGYLATGWWRQACMKGQSTDWRLFWLGLCASTLAVGVYFLFSYQGINKRIFRTPPSPSAS